MKVFIVIHNCDYDSESFFGVYETYEKAEKAIKTYLESEKTYDELEDFDIDEYEVE